LKNINTTQKNKKYVIKYWSDLIEYECDLEGIKCKKIKK
jgi:hypothetical protein